MVYRFEIYKRIRTSKLVDDKKVLLYCLDKVFYSQKERHHYIISLFKILRSNSDDHMVSYFIESYPIIPY